MVTEKKYAKIYIYSIYFFNIRYAYACLYERLEFKNI